MNKIFISQRVRLSSVKVYIYGDLNCLNIGRDCQLNDLKIYIKGNSNVIKISENVIFSRGGEIWIEDNSCLIKIGNDSTFEKVHIAATENNSEIVIGNDCMFATDIEIRSGDSHSIIDNELNKRVNFAKNISIEDHVWIGSGSSILKGVLLKSNTIVATKSVVTKSFNVGNVIIGGVPAKILKRNISWVRQRI